MRSVIGELSNDDSQDLTIVDLEASIEHLSRGTVKHVDALLVVTEPYYRSLETAGRIIPLAQDLGLEHIWVLGNKVRSERDQAAIQEYCAIKEFELLASVPFDENVTEADLIGQALIDHTPQSPAVLAVQGVAATLVERVRADVGSATSPA